MHFNDEEDFDFTAVPVTEEMQDGLIEAFRQAASGRVEGGDCPICAYLASQGHDVAHEHTESDGPAMVWMADDIEALMAESRGAPTSARSPALSKAQRRRFRQRRK